MSNWSRRQFLQITGTGAALAATAAACSSSDGLTTQPTTVATTTEPTTHPTTVATTTPTETGRSLPAGLDKFDHLVVVMFENRSFDNMLGRLYEPGEVPRGQSFDGVLGKDLSNPIPPDAPDADRKIVPVQISEVMDDPNPDPGEEFPHINTQMFGTVIPDCNRYKGALATKRPYNRPPAGTTPDMSGFVADYINNYMSHHGVLPTYDQYRVVMGGFAPESVPVISALAREFAVFDHWHCEVPSQTFCNRSFIHAASSSGLVVNTPYSGWASTNTAPTIFNRMSELGVPWKVYFDHSQVISLTGLIHAPTTRDLWKTNFAGMDDFFADVANGELPAYSFVEPRMLYDHNDMHPPAALISDDGITIVPASNVLAGEALLASVYDAIRTSNATTGSNWRNTALLIVFDEAGGTYDHVPPPSATPPDPSPPPVPPQMDWTFDQLGIRVPAILVSAHTQAGTVVNTPMRHTSTIATLRERFDLGAPLTGRDSDANLLTEAFNLDQPRSPDDWPIVTPRPVPPSASDAGIPAHDLQLKLPDLARSIYGLALAAINPGTEPNLGPDATVGEALAHLRIQFASAFGA